MTYIFVNSRIDVNALALDGATNIVSWQQRGKNYDNSGTSAAIVGVTGMPIPHPNTHILVPLAPPFSVVLLL